MSFSLGDIGASGRDYAAIDIFNDDLRKNKQIDAALGGQLPRISARKEAETLYLEVNFSDVERLCKPMEGASENERKEKFAAITNMIFDQIADEAARRKINVVFEKVVLSGTQASLRSVLHITSDLKILHMDATNVSEKSFANLHLWKNLEELSLDNCSKVSGEIFKSLTDTPIKRLSIVNMNKRITAGWMGFVKEKCPNIEELYIGSNLTGKCEGLYDVANFSTLKNPYLLPCGHIEDEQTVNKKDKCSFCRSEYNRESLTTFQPRVFRRFREKGIWKSEPVDVKRRPLDDKVWYHVKCGELFNSGSIKEIFGKDISPENLQKLECPTCRSPFKDSLRQCFVGGIKGGVMAEEGFEDLPGMETYIAVKPDK